MVGSLRWKNAKVVVEFGPGTGVMTRELLRVLPQDATLLAFEISPRFNRYLRDAIDDDRLEIVQAGAETAGDELRRRGISRVDGVVSSLGLTLMDEPLIDSLFCGVVPFLDEKSKVTQYQYLSSVRLKNGRPVNFNVRSVLDRYFQIVDAKIIWRNIPPAVVYECLGCCGSDAEDMGLARAHTVYSRTAAGHAGSDFS